MSVLEMADKIQRLEVEVRKPFILRVDGEDYKVEYPVASVAALEEKLGRSMKFAGDWLRMQTKELQDIIEAGLLRNHAETAKDTAWVICDTLEVEAIEDVIEGLCKSVFPRAMARIEESAKRMQANAENGIPNVLSADAL